VAAGIVDRIQPDVGLVEGAEVRQGSDVPIAVLRMANGTSPA
jgi:hypothetical protein